MKNIALTFDDGPNNGATVKILDLLEKYQVKASFFVNGKHINEDTYPVIKRMLSLGCDVQNHSFSHPAMPEISDEEIVSEIAKTDELIMKCTGVKPKFFRPPYIAVDERMVRLIDYPFICGRGCDDWDQNVPVSKRIDVILNGAEEGEIILLHDIEDNYKTVEALETIIPGLLDKGFNLVNITELFENYGNKAKAHNGVIYSSAK